MAKVLIIEDDTATRTAIRLALLKDGHDVIEAQDGGEGLIEFAKHNPSVVITDMVMPGINGLEVVTELKRRDPLIRIIAISGDPNMGLESLTRAKKLKADVALVKPFKVGQLRNAMIRFAPPCAPHVVEETESLLSIDFAATSESAHVGPGISYQFSL
tara:strand:- start:6405 stop:6878 length:474 start_codon:yes stop_codon:yes gene_type:complete